MKLNETQEALISRLRKASLHYKQAKATEYEAARRVADERILGALIERDKLIARSIAEGIPLAQIGKRALGTSDYTTVKAAAKHGERFLEDEASTQHGNRYAWDAVREVLTVTMSAEDFTPFTSMLVRTPDEAETFDFTVDGERILPVDADDEDTWEHPVVQIVMTDQGKRDALDFIADHRKD